MRRLPLFLDLSGRLVLVVGAGGVGQRRAEAARAAGALVRIVDADFQPGDVEGAWLVLACAPAEVNANVLAACEERQIWCVRADDADSSPAWMAAVTESADVTVAVSGHGDPGRAIAVRNAIATLLAEGSLPMRRTRTGVGHVTLIGGGPGDPGLITIRGRQELAAADVVVVDRLAPRALVEELEDDVEIIDAGKSSHAHNLTQDEINAVIVERALAGNRVVRLKGGDPFVFGRGGEEALACVAAGVGFTVVPGVTSAISVPALAGIPVTHRGITQDFSVISAHLDPSAAGSTVDWASLARTQGTLVLLMAVERLGAIATALIDGGRAASTPVAVIANGSTEHERVEIGTLAGIAQQCVSAGIAPPAVVVVGEVVSVRERLQA